MPKYSVKKTGARTYYGKTRQEAEAIAARLRAKGETGARVVRYGKGYAVQIRKSGPYVLKRGAKK